MKTIFISHSTMDAPLANALYSLFSNFIAENELDNFYDLFYSPVSLNDEKKYSKNWKIAIRSAIATCESFVLILTPNSVDNRWVNYEIGLATAHNKTIICVGVKGIDFKQVIPNEIQTLSLDIFADVTTILENIFQVDSIHISNWTARSGKNLISRVTKLARPQWVYFAGSEQKNDDRWNDRDVELFVTELSKKLLKAGFKLASFPTVRYVGEVVATCALSYQSNKAERFYEIAGLYKFDENIELILSNKGINIDYWSEIVQAFRMTYLSGKNCMIIIGGGKNTRNEYSVAKIDKNRQIFPIPCFGGCASDLFELLESDPSYRHFRHPCSLCDKKRSKDGSCPHINNFVARMSDFIALPKD